MTRPPAHATRPRASGRVRAAARRGCGLREAHARVCRRRAGAMPCKGGRTAQGGRPAWRVAHGAWRREHRAGRIEQGAGRRAQGAGRRAQGAGPGSHRGPSLLCLPGSHPSALRVALPKDWQALHRRHSLWMARTPVLTGRQAGRQDWPQGRRLALLQLEPEHQDWRRRQNP